MKKLTLAIAAIATIAVSANAGKNLVPAQTEPVPVVNVPLGLYLGAGLTYSHSECKCNDANIKGGTKAKKYDTYGINLKAGYNFTDYLGIEAKYIYTPWGDDNTLKHYGIYLKPSYSISNNIDIYALLGYGKIKCDTNNVSAKGFAWGAGAEYTFNKKIDGKKDGLGVYIEYLRPLKKTGNKNITIDMINAGVSYNF